MEQAKRRMIRRIFTMSPETDRALSWLARGRGSRSQAVRDAVQVLAALHGYVPLQEAIRPLRGGNGTTAEALRFLAEMMEMMEEKQ